MSVFVGVVLSRLGRSTAGAHMQSVRACAVETHFSISWLFLETAPNKNNLRAPFGYHFRLKSWFHVKKNVQNK